MKVEELRQQVVHFENKIKDVETKWNSVIVENNKLKELTVCILFTFSLYNTIFNHLFL